MTRDDTKFREIVTRNRWIFARSMPEDPHCYTLRREFRRDEDFVFLVNHIRTFGKQEWWGGRFYTYFHIDGWAYWTMGNPIDQTILINRCKTDKPND